MTRRRFTRTADAEEELIGLWAYVAADNEPAADRLVERIEEACRRLAEFPELDVAHDEVRAGLRLFPVGNYLLLYRQTEEGIEVVRIVHGARDWRELLQGGEEGGEG
jgi:toxin ParE1/3/4